MSQAKKHTYHLSYELKREIIKIYDETTDKTGLSKRKLAEVISQKIGRPITHVTLLTILRKMLINF